MSTNTETIFAQKALERITPASIDFLLTSKFNEAESIPGADLSVEFDSRGRLMSKYLRGEDNGTLVRIRKYYLTESINGRATVAVIRIRNSESNGFSVVSLDYLESSGQYDLSVRLANDCSNEPPENRKLRLLALKAEQAAGVVIPYKMHESIIGLTHHTIANFIPYKKQG